MSKRKYHPRAHWVARRATRTEAEWKAYNVQRNAKRKVKPFEIVIGREQPPEQIFQNLWDAWGCRFGGDDIPSPERQWFPVPHRQYRADFAWPAALVAVECDGGTWEKKKSGHKTGTGIRAGYERTFECQREGFIVIRLTTDQLRNDGVDWIKEVAEVVRSRMKGD